MKKPVFKFLFFILITVCLSACITSKNIKQQEAYTYITDDKKLYDTIAMMDSIFFTAYNTCDINKQATLYSDSLEFYHDQGGLMTSKKEILDATKKNICGKVTRELVKGSIEVYPIKNFGAVEIGLHKFHNNQEPSSTISKVSKFIIIWHFNNNQWQITKVISLH